MKTKLSKILLILGVFLTLLTMPTKKVIVEEDIHPPLDVQILVNGEDIHPPLSINDDIYNTL